MLPTLPNSRGTFFAKSWMGTGRSRVRVVSWTLVTRPLLPSIFDSVCSLAQTYDLCSVRQHHPSPSRLLGGVGALGAHTGSLSLPPSLLSRDLFSARRARAQPTDKYWGEGVTMGLNRDTGPCVPTSGTPAPVLRSQHSRPSRSSCCPPSLGPFA